MVGTISLRGNNRQQRFESVEKMDYINVVYYYYYYIQLNILHFPEVHFRQKTKLQSSRELLCNSICHSNLNQVPMHEHCHASVSVPATMRTIIADVAVWKGHQ